MFNRQCVLSLNNQISKWIFFLILGIIFAQYISLAQESNKVKHELFFELEEALENAREEEVPIYAPELFAKAVELQNKAQYDFQKCKPIEQIYNLLQLAKETLDRAKEVSNVSKKSLSQVVESRIQINQNELVRYHSPKKLNEAEFHYREAIRQAEIGDISAAKKSATKARSIYRKANLQALEMGPLRNLENQLKYSEKYTPRKSYEEAARELSALKEALKKAKTGDITISMLRARIAVGGSQINQFLKSRPDFGIRPDFISPPAFAPGTTFAPGTFGPPEAPEFIRIVDRTANSLKVMWIDNSSFEKVNKLERREGNGPWEVAEEWGPLSGWPFYTNFDLEPDTLYCYRVRVENSYGLADVTSYPEYAFGYTRDGNNIPVWRVQLKLRTADASGAWTNDSVQVRLNSPFDTWSPRGNGTWLDYAPRPPLGYPIILTPWRDDFGRGSEFTYDLDLRAIRELSDITWISILKEGSDALGIAELSLMVNGEEVYHKLFGGETEDECQWIGNGYPSVYTIFHSELRTHESWQDFIDSPVLFPPDLTISNEHIVSFLESMIGNSIHGTELYWDTSFTPVEATQFNDHTLLVKANLKVKAPGFNPDVDIEFHLNWDIECDPDSETPPILTITTSNFNSTVDCDILEDILELGYCEWIEDTIEDKIEKAWQPITKSISFNVGGLCIGVRVDDHGNVEFFIQSPE